jgi:hypothetical protein
MAAMSAVKTITLKVGGMCGMPAQTCLLSKKSRELLGIAVDDLVTVSTDVGSITRFVLKSPAIQEKDDFVFLSPEDLVFLNIEIATTVDVSLDTCGVACP